MSETFTGRLIKKNKKEKEQFLICSFFSFLEPQKSNGFILNSYW